MHRTLSLDYGVVLSGEITMKLDGGDETIIKAGDYVLRELSIPWQANSFRFVLQLSCATCFWELKTSGTCFMTQTCLQKTQSDSKII